MFPFVFKTKVSCILNDDWIHNTADRFHSEMAGANKANFIKNIPWWWVRSLGSKVNFLHHSNALIFRVQVTVLNRTECDRWIDRHTVIFLLSRTVADRLSHTQLLYRNLWNNKPATSELWSWWLYMLCLEHDGWFAVLWVNNQSTAPPDIFDCRKIPVYILLSSCLVLRREPGAGRDLVVRRFSTFSELGSKERMNSQSLSESWLQENFGEFAFQFLDIIFLLIGWTYRIIKILVSHFAPSGSQME